jgi:excisionase family DNA binding protein
MNREGPEKLMSVEELAVFLQVPLSTIYFWRYRGEGPRATRVGRCLRFNPSDVREWLERRRS